MKTIIFDMDGTLINSKNAICITINNLRKSLGLPEASEDFILKTIHNPKINLALELYNLQSVDAKMHQTFEEEFEKNYRLYARIYDGIDELLKRCKEENYFLAVASNAPKSKLHDVFKNNNILQYFDIILGANEEFPRKPDPKMVIEILKQAKSDKNLFIGDTLSDYETAKNANIDYLNVVWGFSTKIEKDNVENFDNIEDVWNFIKNM